MLRKIILAALAATTLAGPALAQTSYGELRRDREEIRQGRAELRDDLRRGDYREYREDRRELAEDRREYREDRRDFRRDRDWRHGRDWRNDRRTDWRWDGNRHRERWYGYPRGYAYRPYGVGYAVPRGYWGNRYWIARPDYYRLPPAWRGTRWVRVGPDALLIRIGDGFVVRAVRGLWY